MIIAFDAFRQRNFLKALFVVLSHLAAALVVRELVVPVGALSCFLCTCLTQTLLNTVDDGCLMSLVMLCVLTLFVGAHQMRPSAMISAVVVGAGFWMTVIIHSVGYRSKLRRP